MVVRDQTESWSTPGVYDHSAESTIPQLFFERAAANPKTTVCERKSSFGSLWVSVTAKELSVEIRRVAKGLIGMGLQRGDSIAILGSTSYEWTLLDYAALTAGLVVIPIYETSSPHQIEWILTDSDSRMVITDRLEQGRIIESLQSKLPKLEFMFSLDNHALVSIIEAGRTITDTELDKRLSSVNKEDLATIIYTSGTTGKPKGVELTHANFVLPIVNLSDSIPEILKNPHTRILLFLPLAHVLARFIQFLILSQIGCLAHTPDTRNLLADFASFRPTAILSVPRVMEKIYNAADAKAGKGIKLRIFRLAAKTATAYSETLDKKKKPSRRIRFKLFLAKKIVLNKLVKLMGGNVEYVVSGGAPLSPQLGHFFRGMGLSILEGYGLTETTGPSNINLPANTKIGTVGPPIPTMSIKIAPDGEILVKGSAVMRGYHNNPAANEEIFEGGWLHTGDLGEVDDSGRLTITGRKKDIIVTAAGKNVAPAQLEDKLRSHPLISQVVVLGNEKPFISALITLDEQMLPQWLHNHGLPDMDPVAAAQDPKVVQALQRAVDRTNKTVSRAESIRKFQVLSTDFTELNGLLTPSLKVRRDEVIKQFSDQVTEIYTKD